MTLADIKCINKEFKPGKVDRTLRELMVDVNSLSSDEWDHIARDIIYGRTDSKRAKALDADYIKAGIMPEFNSNWDLIMARIEPKEKRDFKRDLNAWKEKYSYKGTEEGYSHLFNEGREGKKMTNDIMYQINEKYERMKEHERDKVEMDNRISEMKQQAKEAVEEQQRYNTFVLRELFQKLVKNIKVDRENKTVIVWWIDGVKTHVHCMDGDEFNSEYGIMRCVFKRAFGSELKAFFDKYIPEVVEEDGSYELEELEKRLVIPKKKNGKRRGSRRGERK